MVNFELAFIYLLGNEGRKYVNDPRDSGGPTKFGITLKAYQTFLGRLVTAIEMSALTEDQAKEFYFKTFWQPCDSIPAAATAIGIFDCAVLYGPGTAALIAQRALSLLTSVAIKIDGIIGDKTVELLDLVGEEDFLEAYHKLIIDRIDKVIAANPSQEVFRHGWTARADKMLTLLDLTPLINELTKKER